VVGEPNCFVVFVFCLPTEIRFVDGLLKGRAASGSLRKIR